MASVTNLRKLDRVHFVAARNITGLRSNYPSKVVLYGADILPFNARFELTLSVILIN
jgi:hypothetical protein